LKSTNDMSKVQPDPSKKMNAYLYQEIVDSYDRERFSSIAGKMFDKAEKDIVLKNIPPEINGSIIEVGAGTGRFSLEIAKMNYQITACDFSLPMLKKIREKMTRLQIDNIDLVNCSINFLPFRDRSADYIYSVRVLNNLPSKKDELAAAAELIRVSRNTALFDMVNSLSIARLNFSDTSRFISKFEMEKTVRGIHSIIKISTEGKRIIPHTIYTCMPECLLSYIEKADDFCCRFLEIFAVRIYFITKKG